MDSKKERDIIKTAMKTHLRLLLNKLQHEQAPTPYLQQMIETDEYNLKLLKEVMQNGKANQISTARKD